MISKIKNINKKPLIADFLGGGSLYYASAFSIAPVLKNMDISDFNTTLTNIGASYLAYLLGTSVSHACLHKKEYKESLRSIREDLSTIFKGLSSTSVLNGILKGTLYYSMLRNDVMPEETLPFIYPVVDSFTYTLRQVYNKKRGLFSKNEHEGSQYSCEDYCQLDENYGKLEDIIEESYSY